MKFEIEIRHAAGMEHLPVDLIAGLVAVESNFESFAWNPEPNYRYFWNVKLGKPFRAVTASEIQSSFPPTDFPSLLGDHDQEWWAQQSSWGLMQVMGAVARELRFAGPYLTSLTVPTIGLSLGCSHLSKLMLWSRGDTEKALAAYNGGKFNNLVRPFHNQAYATKVLQAAAQFR